MTTVRPGLVSVILVNFRGVDDTLEAIGHLRRLEWPQELLEIIVVENDSGDDSLAILERDAADTVIVASKENLGFAGGCNLGVSRSTGEFVAFLNNDARPDATWVSAAVARFRTSSAIGAVASRVLDWDGKLVDYIGSAMTWFGMGYKPLTAQPIPAAPDVPQDVLFGTGSAMFVRRSVFDELGGFDEAFFMFFEDVDLGWRLNLTGRRFVYEPLSVAYHKHHASMEGFGEFKEQYLLERNALFALYKNLGATELAQILPAALSLSIRRGVAKAGLDSTALDLRRPGGDDQSDTTVAKDLLSSVFAIDQFVDALPGLTVKRDAIQSGRVVPDARIWQLFGETDAPSFGAKHYLEGYTKIVESFEVLGSPQATRVVIVTGDPIGRKLAGPAIRAWNMAELLSRSASVTLVSLTGVEDISVPFELVSIRPGDDRAFARLEKTADIIIFQGHAMAVFDSLRRTSKIVVVDIYDPMHLEQLEQGRDLPAATWTKQVTDATDVLNEQLLRGDFFLCASERQKHFYLGQLAALGRINPATYDGDPDLDGLIAVAPFGLSDVAPKHERDVLKGVLSGVGPADKLLLWSGGLYNWFDPETLIRAVADLAARRPKTKLFFQGTKHPHPGVPEMAIVGRSRRLASELGVLDRAVFFNDSWVDYSDRGNYLVEADAGVSTHFAHVETTFSFRTRILDYLWAELPMVVTDGDHFAELIGRENLGIVVPAEDVPALAVALERILYDEDFIEEVRRNIRRVREEYYWSVALQPLLDFVAAPHPAGDRRGTIGVRSAVASRRAPRRRSGFIHDAGLVVHYLRNGGPALVASKVRTRLTRR
jgi:GT2 family glycosyltransferase/glycosyltransferase involved in cell wall biosynthesis